MCVCVCVCLPGHVDGPPCVVQARLPRYHPSMYVSISLSICLHLVGVERQLSALSKVAHIVRVGVLAAARAHLVVGSR